MFLLSWYSQYFPRSFNPRLIFSNILYLNASFVDVNTKIRLALSTLKYLSQIRNEDKNVTASNYCSQITPHLQMKRYLSFNLFLSPPASDLHPAVWKYLSSVRKQSWQLSDNRLLLLMRSSPPGPALVVGEVGDCEVWCHHRCQPRPICQIFLLNFNFTPATCLCRPDPPQHKHCRAHQLTLVIYCILQIAFCPDFISLRVANN